MFQAPTTATSDRLSTRCGSGPGGTVDPRPGDPPEFSRQQRLSGLCRRGSTACVRIAGRQSLDNRANWNATAEILCNSLVFTHKKSMFPGSYMGEGMRTGFNVLRVEICSGDVIVDATAGGVSEGRGPCHCSGSRPATPRGRAAPDPSPGLRPPSPRTRGEGLSCRRRPIARPGGRPLPHSRFAVHTELSRRPPSSPGPSLRSAPHPACGDCRRGRRAPDPSPGLRPPFRQTPHPACGHPLPARGARGIFVPSRPDSPASNVCPDYAGAALPPAFGLPVGKAWITGQTGMIPAEISSDSLIFTQQKSIFSGSYLGEGTRTAFSVLRIETCS